MLEGSVGTNTVPKQGAKGLDDTEKKNVTTELIYCIKVIQSRQPYILY